MYLNKKFKSLGKQLEKIHSNDSIKTVKMYPKNQNSLTRHNTKYIFTKKRDVPRYYIT
jgi:hypothetical protein